MSVDSSKEEFLAAFERLLSQPDSPAPGINAVAREAGLNKVLIYRYFESWNGFLESFAQRVNPWRDLRKETEAGIAANRWTRLADLAAWLFQAYLDKLCASPLLQNLLRLSLVHRDPLQAALEKDREEEGLALMTAIGTRFPFSGTQDPAAQTALLTGGITWLVLAGSRAGQFNGLRFTGPDADAQGRLGSAIRLWVLTLTSEPESTSL